MGEIKKKVYKPLQTNVGNQMHGFVETLEWRCSEYGAPWLPGTYFCSNGDGKVFQLKTTGYNHKGQELMEAILEDRGHCKFDNGDALQDSDIIDLYYTYNIWYDEQDYEDRDSYGELLDYGTGYTIFREPPKYYLVSKLTGPIDSENYEEIIETDLEKFLINHDPKDRDKVHVAFE